MWTGTQEVEAKPPGKWHLQPSRNLQGLPLGYHDVPPTGAHQEEGGQCLRKDLSSAMTREPLDKAIDTTLQSWWLALVLTPPVSQEALH